MTGGHPILGFSDWGSPERGGGTRYYDTVIEMVEILDEKVGKHSVERVRYVLNNILHLVIVKYRVISR